MAPIVHGLEARYFGRIRFSFLDADDPHTLDLQKSLGFYYQPEFYLLNGSGSELMKWVGYVSEQDFEAVFSQYLS